LSDWLTQNEKRSSTIIDTSARSPNQPGVTTLLALTPHTYLSGMQGLLNGSAQGCVMG